MALCAAKTNFAEREKTWLIGSRLTEQMINIPNWHTLLMVSVVPLPGVLISCSAPRCIL